MPMLVSNGTLYPTLHAAYDPPYLRHQELLDRPPVDRCWSAMAHFIQFGMQPLPLPYSETAEAACLWDIVRAGRGPEQGLTETLKSWGMPTVGIQPAGGPAPAALPKVLQMFKKCRELPPAIFQQAGTLGSALGTSQGAVKPCLVQVGWMPALVINGMLHSVRHAAHDPAILWDIKSCLPAGCCPGCNSS